MSPRPNNIRELDKIESGFKKFVKNKRILDLIINEISRKLLPEIRCDQLFWEDADEDGLYGGVNNPTFEPDVVWEIHEDKWLPLLRRADRGFDALCEEYLAAAIRGMGGVASRQVLEEAEYWLDSAVNESFWAELPEFGEEFEDEYNDMRDDCKDSEDRDRDPYRYYGVSETRLASPRSSLIRLASSLEKGSPERRAILAGLSRTS